MSVQITIRNVRDEVRDELAARAARSGMSMQEYLRAELERMAARPTIDAWVERARTRKFDSGVRVTSQEILRARDADRR